MEENPENGTVTFKKDELTTYGVLYYDGNEMMCAITGYDLNIAFNMRLINSIADAESCANALADVFYEALMEQLIEQKADFIKPNLEDKPILNKEE
ncbi:hypothetical protein IR083_07185 [Dysgonomonas sp. GY75]|uniref:hypothetical protein n=1 Tax=Dysgonomonas sp. GY75 TaxID=2780419 RepID=UPI00188330FD|nr:hypothetical protein [Dysgonomonas sp. GY75]MBF0648598.1 hypothetical protein [Dysgonomonas sp. GY75]